MVFSYEFTSWMYIHKVNFQVISEVLKLIQTFPDFSREFNSIIRRNGKSCRCWQWGIISNIGFPNGFVDNKTSISCHKHPICMTTGKYIYNSPMDVTLFQILTHIATETLCRPAFELLKCDCFSLFTPFKTYNTTI